MTNLPGEGAIAWLNPNACKARFGVAYVRAVCSQAGVGFAETSPDEDLLALDGRVNFDFADVGVQVKCSGQYRIRGGPTASWPADPGWWPKWHKSKVPVYFVLVLVDPDLQGQWLHHHDEGTLHRAAAYWVRVDRMAVATSIAVPKRQRLTAETLNEWAADLNACYAPPI